ncbi:MAG: hypothetical protein OXR66_06095 [Candidatus Woesearchaeota archaeon]|nr:hypothetical protein [Candidatus Woesearchaeota archaeon]
MRWLLLILLVVPIATALEPYGCCIPPHGSCFDGSAFTSETDFQNACTQADGAISGAGQRVSCSSYTQCQQGCCCAGSTIFDSPTINNNEELLQTSQNECSVKNGYTFRAQQGSCVETCGGTTVVLPPDEQTYTVSGVVVNSSDTTPLSGVGVYVPLIGGDLSDITDGSGRFSITNVPQMRTRVFAIHPACRPGQSTPIIVDENKDGVEIALTCEEQGCQPAAPTFTVQPTVQRGTTAVAFTVDLTDTCQNFVQYEPVRCIGDFCNNLPPTTTSAIVDPVVQPETEYCYIVRARFGSGATTETSKVCVTTGHELCMNNQEPAWCGSFEGNAAVLRCDEQNQLNPTVCDAWSVCMDRGTPACERVPQCETCNGLMGLFAKYNPSISLDGVGTSPCSSVCSEDSKLAGKTLMCDAFSSCAGVSDCAQYMTQGACERDTCEITQCDWRTVNEELGSGVCVGAKAPCDQCDDLFGYCNRDVCSAISNDCYYDGDENGLSEAKGCIHKDDMACRYYDTEEHCTNGVQAVYDIRYENGERRGTNARTIASRDLYDIGACTWVTSMNKCIKDADNKRDAQQEDDCYENNYVFTDPTCFADSTPPETTFYLSPAPYPRIDLRTIPYAVSDDATPLDLIRTYVCLGANCNPDAPLSSLTLEGAGSHVLRYYSIDASENAEVIKEATITVVDTHQPAIASVAIKEVG